MKVFKPLVAVGPEHALEDEILMADHFRKFYSRQCLQTFFDSSQCRWERRLRRGA
jgi:hypothetical protein